MSRSEKEGVVGSIVGNSNSSIYSDSVGLGLGTDFDLGQGQGQGQGQGMSGAAEYARRIEITLATALAKSNGGHVRLAPGPGQAPGLALGQGLTPGLSHGAYGLGVLGSSSNVVPIVIPVRDTAAGLPPTAASLHDFWAGGATNPTSPTSHSAHTSTNTNTNTSGGTPYTPFSAVNAGQGRGGLAVHMGQGGSGPGHYGHPSGHQVGVQLGTTHTLYTYHTSSHKPSTHSLINPLHTLS